MATTKEADAPERKARARSEIKTLGHIDELLEGLDESGAARVLSYVCEKRGWRLVTEHNGE